MTGICAKHKVVSVPPSRPTVEMAGLARILETSTSPVIRQTTTVSQNVPVEAIRA